ncbi:hypothetical protein ACOME3_008536 [Neoechinorhynchus agilis]
MMLSFIRCLPIINVLKMTCLTFFTILLIVTLPIAIYMFKKVEICIHICLTVTWKVRRKPRRRRRAVGGIRSISKKLKNVAHDIDYSDILISAKVSVFKSNHHQQKSKSFK